MKERPILFSTPMVNAILEGCKTQTRRIVKDPYQSYPCVAKHLSSNEFDFHYDQGVGQFTACPYGQPGDRLWVRETFSVLEPEHVIGGRQNRFVYKAEMKTAESEEARQEYIRMGYPYQWKPSIFMPREAARILLEVTDVRVERLQDITEEDAKAEGITDIEFYPDEGFPLSIGHMAGKDDGKTSLHTTRVKAYAALWESINGEGSWEKNPWAWVISFERIQS